MYKLDTRVTNSFELGITKINSMVKNLNVSASENELINHKTMISNVPTFGMIRNDC